MHVTFLTMTVEQMLTMMEQMLAMTVDEATEVEQDSKYSGHNTAIDAYNALDMYLDNIGEVD